MEQSPFCLLSRPCLSYSNICRKSLCRQDKIQIAHNISNSYKIHQNEINDILIRFHDLQDVDFMNALVEYFGVKLTVSGLDQIPTSGRYIFASNHPLGGLDGICLSSLLGNHFNGDIRYLVNDLLLYLPNLQSIFVPINKHGAQSRENVRKIDEAYASDNQIITFPAGLCSRKVDGGIRDLDWKKSFIQKAVETRRDIVPVYFDGRNSMFFYRFANLRKMLGIRLNIEMIYLPDEMFRAKGRSFRIVFGRPIPYDTFVRPLTPSAWAMWVKNQVYELK